MHVAARQLKQMQDENAEFEGKITAKARAIARQREDFINAQAKLAEFQDEVSCGLVWCLCGVCVCLCLYAHAHARLLRAALG